MEGGDVWLACCLLAKVSCIGKTKDDAVKGVEDAIASNKSIFNK